MKKFIEFVNDMESDSQAQSPENVQKRFNNDTDYKKYVLTKVTHLDTDNFNYIKHQMVNIFQEMCDKKETFPECVKFIVENVESDNQKKTAGNLLQSIDDFFKNTKSKGLAYISGQNQVVNKPNPNVNGATNNSYYQ